MSSPASTMALPPVDPYPEKRDLRVGWLERLESRVTGLAAPLLPLLAKRRTRHFVKQVNSFDSSFSELDAEQLNLAVGRLRGELAGQLDNDRLVSKAFALIREISRRELGMRHYDVQIEGGFALLHGFVAEMATGEGKTLTASLAAATAAMAGLPVHVVSVNDYLARRDGTLLTPVYHALGLSVGIITHEVQPAERKAAYGSDITYASNKEIAFDYLRDRIALAGRPHYFRMKIAPLLGNREYVDNIVMRGLHFAIVDEADSVLADEAGTPLIISQATDPGDERRRAVETMEITEQLQADVDFQVVREKRRIELTAEGRDKLRQIGEERGGIWKSRIRREESAKQALMALYLFQEGDHYIVQEGKVRIVDEYTGRVMSDRSWSDGLHQLVEVKEGCEVTSRKVPLARMTYQRFFRRYRRLAGMSGTVSEIRTELWRVYRLVVLRISTNKRPRRERYPCRLFKTKQQKWDAVAECAARLSESGRPVLIGTRSVTDSELLSQMLSAKGYQHEVINAAQDEREAEIIGQAGDAQRITVATNMAGRGVDIKLAEGVSDIGGLHVILTERHDASRIDRQLEGRCGRQGDRGSYQEMISLEDQLVDQITWPLLLRVMASDFAISSGFSQLVLGWAQHQIERIHAVKRRDLMEHDQRLGVMMAFSGGME